MVHRHNEGRCHRHRHRRSSDAEHLSENRAYREKFRCLAWTKFQVVAVNVGVEQGIRTPGEQGTLFGTLWGNGMSLYMLAGGGARRMIEIHTFHTRPLFIIRGTGAATPPRADDSNFDALRLIWHTGASNIN